MVDFKRGTKKDFKVIERIVRRLSAFPEFDIDEVSVRMDIMATHISGCPLDFDKLEGFDDFNFLHDMGGISEHLDRKTGKLKDCFLPRCSKKEA